MKFELTPEQVEKVSKWYEEVSQKVIEKQKETMLPEDFDEHTSGGKYPYYGAIGGGLTYMFSKTSLGTVVIVEEAITGEKLDVTDYDHW